MSPTVGGPTIRCLLAGTASLVLSALLLAGGSLPAAPAGVPSYEAVRKKLPELWKARFPVEALSFKEAKGNQRILRAIDGGQTIYYYRFAAIIPVLTRKDDGSMKRRAEREAEFYVRLRPGLAEPFDITFARSDLLPGSSRVWLRYP